MLFWAINACKKSQYIDHIYVSSDSYDILNLAEEYGAMTIQRPKELSNDFVYKQEAIVHAATLVVPTPDIVISLQPNSPEIKYYDLDNAIFKLFAYERNEIFSVGRHLMQNAAFRIMRYSYVFQKTLSTKCGVYIANYIDVHTEEDVKNVETRGKIYAPK